MYRSYYFFVLLRYLYVAQIFLTNKENTMERVETVIRVMRFEGNKIQRNYLLKVVVNAN
jgi:hypothetical protein